jgi:hypothetical protein
VEFNSLQFRVPSLNAIKESNSMIAINVVSGKTKWVLLAVLVVSVCVYANIGMAQVSVSVLTQHNDNGRTGQNLQETTLNTSNVNVAQFGKLFSRMVDGNIFAQPLYVPNLSISGATHNVIFVATEHNSVFAFDADDPNASTALWQLNLGPSMPSSDICIAAPQYLCPYTDLIPEIGITSTPVIDLSSNTIYVVAKTKDSTNDTYHFNLHALDITSGEEKFAGPVEITASVPGSGDGGSTVNFNALTENNRPGLLLLNGEVYIAFGSVGDVPTFHGWVFGYDAQTLAQVAVLCTTPNSYGGGMWSTGNGLNADAAGNLYVVTGNGGTFDVNTGGKDFGSAYIKLSGDLSMLDYFAPSDVASLNTNNTDLSSGGFVLITEPSGADKTVLAGGGKDGLLRVMDSSNMGKFNASINNNLQNFSGTNPPIFGSPVYWNSPNFGPVIYLWGQQDFLKAWSLNTTTSQFNTTPVSQANIQGVGVGGGDGVNTAAASLSANGGTAGTDIIWASTPYGNSGCTTQCEANPGPVPGALYAFDATDLTKELWDSQMNSSRDAVGNYAKFSPPTIANGKVYLATFSGQLQVYGLLVPPDFSVSASPPSESIAVGNSASYIVFANELGGFTGTVSLACSGLPSGASCSFNPTTLNLSQGNSENATLTINTSGSIAPGTFNVTVTGTSGSLNHNTSLSLTVTAGSPPAFMLSASPTSGTVSAGGSVTSKITVTPTNGFAATVNLTCSVTTTASPPPTCLLSAASVNTSSGPGMSTLTFNTSAAHASLATSPSFFYATLLPIGSLTVLGAAFTSRRKKFLGLVVLCVLFSGLIFLPSCSGGSSSSSNGGGTPSGTYTVMVAGSSSSLSGQTTFSVTVQ